MAVTKVMPQWQGRGASVDEKGVRTLKRSWLVATDGPLTAEPDVIDAVTVVDPSAALYAPHPAWPWSVCRSLTAAPHQGPTTWLVEANYSSAPFSAAGDGSGKDNNSASPSEDKQSNKTKADQRPPTITISRKEVTEPLVTDAATGKPVVNVPVGDPFDPPAEVFRSRHVITWEFFVAPENLDWSTRSQFLDSVNATAYTVLGYAYPARTLRCTDYSLKAAWDTGSGGMTLYFQLTVQAEYKPDTWDVHLLNAGRRMLVGSLSDPANPPKKVFITGDDGQPVSDPVPLLKLTGQPVPINPALGPPAYDYVDFFGYVSRDWTNLLA